jgi:hypothetical protein
MSGAFDEIFSFVGGMIEAIGDGVSAIGHSLFGLGQSIIHDIKEKMNIAVEEKKQKRLAFDRYLENISLSETSKSTYIAKMLDSVNVDGNKLSEYATSRLQNQSFEMQSQILNQVLAFQTINENYKQLFYDFASEGIELPEEEVFYTAKEKAIKKLQSGDYGGFLSANEEFISMITKIKKTMLYLIEQKKIPNIEKTDALLFIIEHNLNEPFTEIFFNELTEIMLLPAKSETQEEEQKLLEIKKQIVEITDKLNGIINSIQADAISSLVGSIKSIIFDEKLSTRTKIESIDIRRRALWDMYCKFKTENTRTLELKEKYDHNYIKYASAMKYLGLELVAYVFNPKTAKQDTNALQENYKKIEADVKKKQSMEYIRKTVRETLQSQKYTFVGTENVDVKNHKMIRDIYHIENGNVVSVTIKDNNSVNYFVSGVKIQGVTENKPSVVKTMHKFCDSKKQIDEILLAKGVAINSKDKLDPSEMIATEIEIPNTVLLEKKEFLRKQRLGTKTQVVMKQMEVK